MAKGIYVGGSVPKFITTTTTTTTTTTINIDINNIEEYFDVYHDEYSFSNMQYGDTIFTSNNKGIDYSTAYTTLTARQDISSIIFSYSYASEKNYDKFTLIVAGEVIEDGVSGAYTVKTYSGALAAGDVISFEYAKDSSTGEDYDECDFSHIKIQVQVQVQTEVQVPDGTIDNVARKVVQPYVGVDNVARKVAHGYVGVDNIARRVFGDSVPMVSWEKYACDFTPSQWVENSSSSLIGTTKAQQTRGTLSGYQLRFWNNYSHDTEYGYQLSSNRTFESTYTTTQEEIEPLAVGCYRTEQVNYSYWEEALYRVESITNFVNEGSGGTIYWTENLICIGHTEVQDAVIEQYNYLGLLNVPVGELPETGTCVYGSATASQCVLQIGSQYYLYKKVS